MVRDEQGMFIPCAHFSASAEDGDIISAALEVLRGWTGRVHGWKLRYMLTDDSAAEQRGVRLGFADQDEPVGHLLDSWALCARNQVTTTNNLESWAQIAQKRGRDLVRSSHGYTEVCAKSIRAASKVTQIPQLISSSQPCGSGREGACVLGGFPGTTTRA
jgi:hypothetical protein